MTLCIQIQGKTPYKFENFIFLVFNLLERFTVIAGLSKVLYNFYLRTSKLIFLMVKFIFRVKFPLLCHFLRISVQAKDVTIKMKKYCRTYFSPLEEFRICTQFVHQCHFQITQNLQIAIICCRTYFTPLEEVSICTLVQVKALRHNVYGLHFNHF